MRDILDKENWLNACVDINDNPDNYEIILIQESVNAINNPSGKRWIKVALRIKETDKIMMATITNDRADLEKQNGSLIDRANETRLSESAGWYLDRRTLQTSKTFWHTLKDIL